MNTSYRHRYFRIDLSNILILAIIALVTVIPFVYSGKVLAISDWSFHVSRVEQIYRNLKAGHLFTFIGTSTFKHSGAGSFLFYPTLFLYPWALLRFIFSPVLSFYIWYALLTFVSLAIAYYSMQKFAQQREVAFAYALIYVFNNYRLYLGHAVFGEFIASAFLPLVFLGFYTTFFKKDINSDWYWLPIGLTLVAYAHILSVFILVEVFAGMLLTACFFRQFKQILSRWRVLLESIIIFCILSLPIEYLFVKSYIGKGVSSAQPGITPMLLIGIRQLASNSLKGIEVFNMPFLPYGIGTILILTAVFGWAVAYKSRRDLFIYVWGLILLLVSTKVFPWLSLQHTPFSIIQLPIRYLNCASLLLAVIAAKAIVKIIQLVIHNAKAIILLLSFAGVLGFSYSESQYIRSLHQTPVSVLSKKPVLTPLPTSYLDNKTYQNQFNYSIVYGETDYYPYVSLKYAHSIVSQIAYFNGQAKTIKSKGGANQLTINYHASKSGNLDLPVVAYQGTYAKINHRSAAIHRSKRSTVQLHLKPGHNRIVVGYNPGVGFFISLIISIIAWGFVIYRRYSKDRLSEGSLDNGNKVIAKTN